MATLKELNIKIGADISDLQAKMRKAANTMRREGQRLSQLGNELTMTITAPLAGLGIAAIKSAGDMEALTNALKTTMGDAAAATKEIELLRKEALKPGLNFEQALKGSVRLQAVGLDAETARAALGNFGNALALAGGKASDLDGVTLALTQIISKGKVSAEEINQLAERVPQIRKVMKDVFGTADTEELQKMGIAAEDFVKKVTAEFGKLPQATGGIQNALENMAVAGKEALANLGLEINRVFDLQAKIEAFGKYLGNLVQRFMDLEDGTKRNIVLAAALAAAIGPVIKVYGVLRMAQAAVLDGFKSALDLLKNLSEGALNAAAAFQKFSMAQKLVIGGFAALIAIGVIAVISQMVERSNELAESQRRVTNAIAAANTQIEQEKIETGRLFDVMRDTTKSTDERRAALDELRKRYPAHLENLSVEKSSLEDITTAQRAVNDELVKTIALQQKNAAASEIAGEIAKKRVRITQLQAGAEVKAGEAAKVTTGEMIRFGGVFGGPMKAVVHELQQEIQGLEKSLTDIDQVFAKTFGTANTGSRRGGRFGAAAYGQPAAPVADSGGTSDYKAPVKETKLKGTAKVLADLNKELAAVDGNMALFGNRQQFVEQRAKALQAAITDLLEEGMKPTSPQIASLQEQFYAASEQMREITTVTTLATAQVTSLGTAYQTLSTSVSENIPIMNEGIQGMGEIVDRLAGSYGTLGEVVAASMMAMSESTKQGAGSLRDLGKVALKAAADVLRAKIIEGVASVVADSLKKFGLFGLAIGGGAGVAAGALFNKVIGGLKIPALAEGGLAYGPQLAMVGDNPGARTDPEVIAPLSKLQTMMGSNKTEVSGTVRVNGSDLLIVLDNATRNRGRSRGY